jgi:hypothetical protein
MWGTNQKEDPNIQSPNILLCIYRLPPCVMAHFVEGVKNKDFLKNGFVCQGKDYELCQLIQYKKNPDHFIAWIRNGNGMSCLSNVF